jgi:thiol-disulfide isomerase/thioredoxin
MPPEVSRWLMRYVSLALILCVLGMPGRTLAAPAAAVQIGDTLRAARLQGLNGPSRNLSEFRGRALIINVWASWCGPCRAEMASLERLAWRDEGRAFAIIGISTDDFPEQASEWLKHSNATISHYIDRELQMEHMLGASSLPLTVLVDRDGRVLDKVYGARQWDSPESIALLSKTFRNQKPLMGPNHPASVAPDSS